MYMHLSPLYNISVVKLVQEQPREKESNFLLLSMVFKLALPDHVQLILQEQPAQSLVQQEYCTRKDSMDEYPSVGGRTNSPLATYVNGRKNNGNTVLL